MSALVPRIYRVYGTYSMLTRHSGCCCCFGSSSRPPTSIKCCLITCAGIVWLFFCFLTDIIVTRLFVAMSNTLLDFLEVRVSKRGSRSFSKTGTCNWRRKSSRLLLISYSKKTKSVRKRPNRYDLWQLSCCSQATLNSRARRGHHLWIARANMVMVWPLRTLRAPFAP